MFEQNVESELENSSGEYETATERNSRERRTDDVRDVICDVTHMKWQFLGPRMETKKSIKLGEIWSSPGSCQGHCQESVRVTKTLCAIARPPRRPRSGYQRTSRSTPGQTFGPPSLLIVAHSFILSVALEGNKLTNRNATTKASWGLGLSWHWESFMGHDDWVL